MTTMHPRTESVLEKLEKLEWFSNVGTCRTQTAKVVTSWSEAAVAVKEIDYGDLKLEGANYYSARLFKNTKDHDWNGKVEILRPRINDLVEAHALKKVPTNFRKPVEDHVRWDILHFCMEIEYSDIISTGYYTDWLICWYFKGYFPCGWHWRAFPQAGWNWHDIRFLGCPIVY